MDIGVVIPTLNEDRTLAAAIEPLVDKAAQIVVSDGGSTDSTEEVARRFPVTWVSGRAGRGTQMNRGAAACETAALIFLHADTQLPEAAFERITDSLRAGYVGGGFLVRFDSEIPVMAVGARLVNLRTRLTRVPLGDQAQFVRTDLFGQIGGFRDWPILEDLDFMRRLRREGKVAVLGDKVLTSDRRYAQHGVFRTVALNWAIWARFLGGARPDALAELYRQYR
jgi:rSAM/selenodomain-associated transferase 2